MKPIFKFIESIFVHQHGHSDCGVACLASIIQYHEGQRTLDEIRQLCGTTKLGTSLLGLYQGAITLGFDAVGLEAEEVDNLKELENPAILHIILENRLQHYVVYYGFDGDQLIIGDPSRGIEKWSKKKLEEVWESRALLRLSPNYSFQKNTIKKNRYHSLIDWVKEDTNILLASLFLGILMAVFSLATAIFSQKLIDVILPTKDMIKLVVGLVLFGIVLLAKNGLGFVRSTFLITQSKDFNNRMFSSFFQSLLNLPKSFFDSKKTGEMIARMNDTRRIQSTISNLAGNLLIEFLVIITSLIGVFVYSWQVGIIVSCFIPIYILILWLLNKPIINAQKDLMGAYAMNESNYVDVIKGISEVKSTASTELFHKTTTFLYSAFQDQIFKLGKIQIRFGVLTELAGILLLICVISYASRMVFQDQLLIGSMMAIISLSGSIGPSMARIAIFNIQMQEAKVAFNRMEEFTGLAGESTVGDSIDGINQISLEKVTFHYPGTLDLLKEIRLKVQKGKISALLGESGSGKSTILQLIQGFYHPVNGQILIDGKDIESIDIQSFRMKVGVIPQNIKIFNNYLLFNICLSESQEDYEKVIPWCKKTGFDKFFNKFPDGYMTLLGEEGANISGGQKQLVGLARALFKNPDILIIDEGTAAMDRDTEKFVMELLRKLTAEKGVLMVTHRIPTAMEADEVYLLENGEIVDSGDPNKLIVRENFLSEYYKELVQPVL